MSRGRGTQRGTSRAESRGQSAPISTLLMVALTLVAAGAAGVVLLDLTPDLLGTAPSATVDVTAADNGPDAQSLVVTHRGGDDLRLDDVDVVVRDGGHVTRLPLSAFGNRSGTTGGVVDAGDSLRTTQLLTGPTTVQLVHRPSGSVIDETHVTLPSGGPSVVDFEASAPTRSFESGQDGTGSTSVADGGATVRQSGNQWKYVDRDYTVTENTTLVFEFNSTSEGEIHGIGLEDDQRQSSDRIVKLYGTQSWGEPVSQFAGLDSYSAGDGWVRYEVPIGELYRDNGDTGPVDYLVFITDCDTNSDCDPDRADPPNSAFRNVRIYENGSAPSLAPVSEVSSSTGLDSNLQEPFDSSMKTYNSL